MESPVRICLSAVVIGNLLLLSSIAIRASALPVKDSTSTTIKDKTNLPRFGKINSTTWLPRVKQKTPDLALNELNPKESINAEHTESKNSKYKDRGRIKFNSATSSSTESSKNIATKPTSEPSKLTIVTPTPEQKNLSQIIDSMREYKKTKIPVLVISSTSPMPVEQEQSSSDENDEYENEEDDDDDFTKFTSGKFHDSSFYTIPGFSDDDFSHDSERSEKLKKDFSVQPYEKYSSYFPKEISYSPKREKYNSDSYFQDFVGDLTTPKNDFFDKKYHEITSSIFNNLALMKTHMPTPNTTNVHKIVKENVGLETLSNGSPNNKSRVIIKNTKEIRLLDNEEAGSANKELSDVHGTSIYYEMSVLSTETYAIHDGDDCDNDTLPYEPTPSTSYEEEKTSVKATAPTIFSSKPSLTVSNIQTPSDLEFQTENPIKINQADFTTDRTTPKVFSSSFSSRRREYPKRINFSNKKEISNSVTVKNDQHASNQYLKPIVTRRIQYTTPKTKPVWMAPRRNITRTSYTKSPYPTTIYSEHFNIKDKLTSKSHNRTSVLTTVSSDIDPVYQTDVMGTKKVVHSQTISDNSIPGLRKRGSAKFSISTSSTPNSTEVEDASSNMEIPPTSTAWALAGMRNPPSLTSSVVNGTSSAEKSVDENELQAVGEIIEKKQTTTISTISTISGNNIISDFTPKKIYDVDQNRLQWKPVSMYAPSSSSGADTQTERQITESKSERVPAESNISLQSSVKPAETTTEIVKDQESKKYNFTDSIVSNSVPPYSTTHDSSRDAEANIILPVVTKATAFESITKLPSDLTTPHSDDVVPFVYGSTSDKIESTFSHNTARPITTPVTDDEITTIRFTYTPTVFEELMETTELNAISDTWHPVLPSRSRTTTLEDSPITTYRPKYKTTTDIIDDETTIIQETSTPFELSSSVAPETQENLAASKSTMTDATLSTTELPVTTTYIPIDTTPKPEETTTIIVEVVTEINTEREIPRKWEKTTANIVHEDLTSQYVSTETEMYTKSSSKIFENSSESTNITPVKKLTTTSDTMIFTETTTPIKIETTEEMRYDTTTQHTEETTTLTTTIPTKSITEEVTMKITAELPKPVREPTKGEDESILDSTTEVLRTTDDLSSYGETTIGTLSTVIDDAGSGAAVAIAVSTIGVIALIMLVGLLLVVRRRGRRGVYAQRCTPVSLDAYSLDSVSVGPRKGNQRVRASKRSYGNPAYDDEVTSHPMQYAALANFALDVESITAEFSEIPSVCVRPDEVPVGCEDKNRYSNVLPLPETRVHLQRIDNDIASEYINANFITGPGNIKNYYIACQAPLPSTVADFWRMIWEQNSRLVVMLTEYMENGVEKCYEYLPPSEISDNKRTFGDYQIVLKKREQRDKYAISSVQVINLVTRTWREITHLWYFWPAKGVPDDYDSIIDFLSEMRGHMKVSQTAKEYDEEGVEVIYDNDSRSSFNNLSKLRSDEAAGNGVHVYSPQRAEELMRRTNNGTLGRMKAAADLEGVRPCVVVCASGAGRSAAVIALDIAARALAAGQVDVPRVVRELRAQRPHSLANRHHYIFLYKVLSEYGNKLMGGGVDTI